MKATALIVTARGRCFLLAVPRGASAVHVPQIVSSIHWLDMSTPLLNSVARYERTTGTLWPIFEEDQTWLNDDEACTSG